MAVVEGRMSETSAWSLLHGLHTIITACSVTKLLLQIMEQVMLQAHIPSTVQTFWTLSPERYPTPADADDSESMLTVHCSDILNTCHLSGTQPQPTLTILKAYLLSTVQTFWKLSPERYPTPVDPDDSERHFECPHLSGTQPQLTLTILEVHIPSTVQCQSSPILWSCLQRPWRRWWWCHSDDGSANSHAALARFARMPDGAADHLPRRTQRRR